jgi:hypothetical protein
LGLGHRGERTAWHQSGLRLVDDGHHESRPCSSQVARAVGLNEFAGCLSIDLTAFLADFIAQRCSLRPQPFYLGISYAVLGLVLSTVLVRDTRDHVGHEISHHHRSAYEEIAFWEVLWRASFGAHNLFAASQAGLVNNLNFGMCLGIFPLFYAGFGLVVQRIGILNSVYPAVWGVLQTLTGPLSDRWGPQGLDRDRNVGAR